MTGVSHDWPLEGSIQWVLHGRSEYFSIRLSWDTPLTSSELKSLCPETHWSGITRTLVESEDFHHLPVTKRPPLGCQKRLSEESALLLSPGCNKAATLIPHQSFVRENQLKEKVWVRSTSHNIMHTNTSTFQVTSLIITRTRKISNCMENRIKRCQPQDERNVRSIWQRS